MLAQAFADWIDWFTPQTLAPAVSEALLVLAIALTLGARVALRRTRLRQRLDSALALLALGLAVGAVALLGPPGRDAGPLLYVRAFCVAAVAIGAARVLLVLFVDFHVRRRRGAAVSRIFSDVGSVLIYFLIIGAVLRFTLDLDLTSLVATSAVLTAIVGLAFQDVLGSVVSGLAIEIEDPFVPGDWIRVGSHEGKVLETGWRTTRIRTRVDEVITLPNTFLAREPVVNYSRPSPLFGDTFRFEAGLEAPPDVIKQAAFAVLHGEPAVLRIPAAEVRTEQFTRSGVQYALRYWIDDFDERERIHARIVANLWYSLRRFGVRLPLAGRDIVLHPTALQPTLAMGDTRAAIGRVGLCGSLGEERLDRLAQQAERNLFGDGETIVRQGDAGDSFFILEHGRARVLLATADGAPAQALAELQAGDYFGEMSLLAGEPRSATVVALGAVSVLELGRAAFQEIVEADPSVLEPMSQVAAQRAEEQRHLRQATQRVSSETKAVDAQRLLLRIRAWFRV